MIIVKHNKMCVWDGLQSMLMRTLTKMCNFIIFKRICEFKGQSSCKLIIAN